MSDKPTDYVVALAAERAGYVRASKTDRADAVDAELKRLGWSVDDDGELVQSKAPAKKAAAKPAETRPESGSREKRA